MQTILVIAAHPDDEVLGCGGTIKKLTKRGDEVCLCIVTKAYTPDWSRSFLEKRKIEIKNACKILGIKRTFLLGFPTAKLDTIPQKKINDSLYKVIRSINPTSVFLPFGGDLNIDHRIVFESGLVACRPVNNSSVRQLLVFEALSETEWGVSNFHPTVYEDITETITDKLHAMEAYSSEVKQFPHPRSLEAIEALAKKRGSEAGLMRAEAFMPVRVIDGL